MDDCTEGGTQTNMVLKNFRVMSGTKNVQKYANLRNQAPLQGDKLKLQMTSWPNN